MKAMEKIQPVMMATGSMIAQAMVSVMWMRRHHFAPRGHHSGLEGIACFR